MNLQNKQHNDGKWVKHFVVFIQVYNQNEFENTEKHQTAVVHVVFNLSLKWIDKKTLA